MAVGAVLAGCGANQEKADFVRSVVVTTPKTIDSETVKRFSGIVNEGREIAVGFKTPGQIKQILVKEGDFVREGQLLASLDDKDYKLGVQAAEIQYNQMKSEVERLKKLFDAKTVSGNDFEKALAGLEQLEVQLKSNRNKLEYTKLYSPSSGYIQKSNFENSEMVDAGTPVFTLLDTKKMEVSLSVPSEFYLQKDNVSEILCRSQIFDNKDFKMKITTVAPKADGNQLYQMRLAFLDSNVPLPAGINVDVIIKLSENQSVEKFSLPLSSVFNSEGKAFVYVVENDTVAVKKEINLIGVDGRGNALTDTPLSTKSNIVRAGVSLIRDGEKVRILTQDSKTNVGNLM